MATVKAFIRKNADRLLVKELSDFNGMTDSVERVEMDWKEISADLALGAEGVWLVGNSRDYVTPYETETHTGFKIYNCCGSGVVAIKK